MAHSILQILLVTSGGLVQADLGKDVDPVWLDRAKTEIRILLDEYRDLCAQIDVTSEVRVEQVGTARDPKFRNKTIQMNSSSLNKNSLLEMVTTFDDDKGKPTIHLECRNEDYSFELTKNGADSRYALAKYAPATPGEPVGLLAGAHVIAFQEIPHIMGAIERHDGYVLKAIQWDDAKHLLHVRFDAKRGSATKPFIADQEIWLDPSNHWQIVEVNERTPRQTRHLHMTYGPSIDGPSFPVQYTEMIIPSRTGETPHQIKGTLKVVKTDKSPRDFRLSTFGLPEPVGMTPEKKVPNYVWILSAAAACGILAVVCRLLARKLRSRATA